jgi:hypothetical protein
MSGPVFVQNTSQNNTGNISLTGVTAGNSLYAGASYHNYGGGPALPTVTDSSGQTWISALSPPSVPENTQPIGVILWKLDAANAGTHNLTWNTDVGGGGTYELFMAEFSWGGPLGIDKTNYTSSTVAGITTLSSGPTGTLTNPNELVIAGITVYDASETTAGITDPPTGFTSLAVQNSGVASQITEWAYKITTATTSLNPNWTWAQTAQTAAQALIVSFGYIQPPLIPGPMPRQIYVMP